MFVTTDRELTRFPALRNPPIFEVVCGVGFAPIMTLDALEFGVYWESRKGEYPHKAVLPPLFDATASFSLTETNVRVWLISPDDAFVLQFQHDRFYMNWRSRGAVYPRFSDRPNQPGLMSRALEEFNKFSDFCASRTSVRPIPKRIELSKIDLLMKGKHWTDLGDLAALLPITDAFKELQNSSNRELSLRFAEDVEAGKLTVNLSTANIDGGQCNAVRVDTRMVVNVGPEDALRDKFQLANDVVNTVFFKLIPDIKRFEREDNS